MLVQHPVADTQFIDDVFILSGLTAKLFANIGHVHLKLFHTAVIHGSPNRIDNGRIGHHFANLLTEQGENIEFRLGYMNDPLANCNLPAVIVDFQIVQCKNAGGDGDSPYYG